MVLGRHLDYFHFWTKIGWAGVDLFFVLSGFLISGLLFTDWKTHNSIDIKRFYIRRGLKIYPPFYVLLAVTAVSSIIWPRLAPFAVNPVSVGVEALFLQNYFLGIWGHTWSLAVEEHFYLALPLVLWIIRDERSSDPFFRLPRLFLIVSMACMLMRLASPFAHEQVSHLVRTHLRIDGLLFGVLLGYYRHFRTETFNKLRKRTAGLFTIVLSVAVLILVPLENPIMHTVGFTCLYLGFGLLLVRVIDLEASRYSAPIIKPLAAMGSYSYSIYLWHFGIARLLPVPGLLTFICYVTLSITFGVAMAKLIEIPTLAFRDRLFPSRSRLVA